MLQRRLHQPPSLLAESREESFVARRGGGGHGGAGAPREAVAGRELINCRRRRSGRRTFSKSGAPCVLPYRSGPFRSGRSC